ncbi:MAG: hypothetical protein MHMPM18_001148 [Marteilia pararefringens]
MNALDLSNLQKLIDDSRAAEARLLEVDSQKINESCKDKLPEEIASNSQNIDDILNDFHDTTEYEKIENDIAQLASPTESNFLQNNENSALSGNNFKERPKYKIEAHDGGDDVEIIIYLDCRDQKEIKLEVTSKSLSCCTRTQKLDIDFKFSISRHSVSARWEKRSKRLIANARKLYEFGFFTREFGE